MKTLEQKLNAVTKSCKRVVRKLTAAEATQLIDRHCLDLDIYEDFWRSDDWFIHNGSQVVLNRRPTGQHVIYTI